MFRSVKIEIDGNPDLQRLDIVALLHRAADRIEAGDDSFYLYDAEGAMIYGEVVIRKEY